jgi:glutathione synthase/RimK-type ligase-like ATP-grasp enzyme
MTPTPHRQRVQIDESERAMFLIIGYDRDKTTRHLCTAAADARVDFEFLDLGVAAEADRVGLAWNGSNLEVALGEKAFDLSDYDAFYSRLYFQGTGSARHDAALNEVVSWVGAYLEQSDALVLNRPASGWSNFNKLQHARELRDVGFRVPDSFIVGSPVVARALLSTGRWVSKPCSGTRSETVLVDERLQARLHLLERAPSQFQEYVEGSDVRVHWLRGECFALEIRSASGIDYRFGDEEGEFTEIDVPPAIAQRCAAFAKRARLEFAGFDFKRDAQGEWVALEANPMPGFDYYDRRLDGAISRRIVQLLAAGAAREEPFIENSRRPPVNRVVPSPAASDSGRGHLPRTTAQEPASSAAGSDSPLNDA